MRKPFTSNLNKVVHEDYSLEDTRLYKFLDTVGSTDCRNKIKEFQIFLLKHKNEAIEKLKWYSKGAKLPYEYTGSIGKSFEYFA